MTPADPRPLVQSLTHPAREVLQHASQRAHTCGHYEVTVAHFVEAMLSEKGGEGDLLLGRSGIDRETLRASITTERRRLRSGNGGRPRLSPGLTTWLLDSWVTASLERHEFAIRTGVLLVQLARRPNVYLEGEHPALARTDASVLTTLLDTHCGASDEAREAIRTGGSDADEAGPIQGSDTALQRFTADLTEAARNGRLDPVLGRQMETRQLVDVLVRRRKNNPLIVGEPGVGKTALVEGLALAIHEGRVPPELAKVSLLALDLGALQAGAHAKGEYERRFKQVLKEVTEASDPVILFIDEAHILAPDGGNPGSGDAANLLKPALARGQLRMIAATTWAEYKRYFEKDAALERRFQPIRVEEPTEEQAVAMLRGIKARYEDAHGLVIQDGALVAAVRMSKRYLPGRQLPDKAVDLLDTAAARLRVEHSAGPQELAALEESISLMEVVEQSRMRDLRTGEPGTHSHTTECREQLNDLKESRNALAGEFHAQSEALQKLKVAQQVALAEHGPESEVDIPLAWATFRKAAAAAPLLSPDVDEDAIARTVSSWTGIPLGKMREDSKTALDRIQEKIERRVVGQPFAAKQLADSLQIAGADIHNPDKPVGVFLFVGPSGVGKTETALTLADHVYGGERFLTTVNMSEFQEKHTVSRLVGSPPGYVGYGEGGKLTEAVRKHPYSVLLLDEVEKAHPDVLNLFYQVFDKGVLADGEGREVCFRNTLIILTSNLASDQLENLSAQTTIRDESRATAAIRPTLSAHFKPALLARMAIIPFFPIQEDAMDSIVEAKLDRLSTRIEAAHGLKSRFAPSVHRHLTQQSLLGTDGARTVDHLIRQTVMPEVARTLLRLDPPANSVQLFVDMSQDGDLATELCPV